VRKDRHLVAHHKVSNRHIVHAARTTAVRQRRHAPRQRAQDGGRLRHGEGFQRLAACEHQDHDGAGEIFAQQRRGDDRDAGEMVRPELSACAFPQQPRDQRYAAGSEHGEQRPGRAEDEMREDSGNRRCRDERTGACAEAGHGLGLIGR
jgi:hypothetical protein